MLFFFKGNKRGGKGGRRDWEEWREGNQGQDVIYERRIKNVLSTQGSCLLTHFLSFEMNPKGLGIAAPGIAIPVVK